MWRFTHFTHGAFGAIAFGGTSEVEMVLYSASCNQNQKKCALNGTLSKGVGPKDVAYIISQLFYIGERAILLNMRVMYLKKSMEGI
jgi:homoaconitase/3-isopropylmalate dehydratase large subunit